MNATIMSIFNQLTGQYSGSIAGIQAGSVTLGKELFNAIALLSVGLLGINRLLRKNVDMVESNIELIRWLVYLNVFYLFLTQYDQFLPFVVNSFQQAGAYLGGKAGGSYAVPTPASIISNGFAIAWKIFVVGLKQTLFLNLGITMISVVIIVVILYCFGMIAVELLLLQIGSQIILAGGIFLLAFSGLEWTRDYAERYVHTFFQVGIKMLFMYLLIGIGSGLTNNWAQSLDNIPNSETFQYQFAVVMATFVYYILCQKLPEQATVYFTGRFPMGFNAVPSLPDLVKGAFVLPNKVTAIKAAIQGNAKAGIAARQAATASFQAQGKTPSPQDIQNEAIKTLGEAKKVEWGKIVDDTKGGKLAKTILDSEDTNAVIIGTHNMNSKTTDPYIKARKEYDEITHNINASKQNWQRIAFVLGGALIISIASNIFTIKKAHVVPYIVEVDNLGRALAVSEAKELPLNDERITKAFVYQYIDMARSVISDPEALRDNLSQVYQESIRSVQGNFLDDYYKHNNPFDYAQKKGTRHIELLVFLKEAENTYSVEWREIERNYDNQVLGEAHYKALISVIQIPHTDEDQYRENPLNPFGLYVTSLSWAKLM